MKNVALALALVPLLACGKSDKAADKKAAPAIDVAAVNALVPADLKAKLVFDKTDIVEERGKHSVTYTMAAPKGWTSKMKGFASLHPADDDPKRCSETSGDASMIGPPAAFSTHSSGP